MRNAKQKYLVDKIAELIRFCFTMLLLGFLAAKAPDQVAQIIAIVAAFLLGGSSVGSKVRL